MIPACLICVVSTKYKDWFMLRSLYLLICLSITCFEGLAQVKIKLFSDFFPESAVFIVTEGSYDLFTGNGDKIQLPKNSRISITGTNHILTVKQDDGSGINTPFVTLQGSTGNDAFSITINKKGLLKRNYFGNLICTAGMGYVNLFNSCPTESYIAGVVLAEGGTGQGIEYYKTQSVLARTYMFKYLEENISEKDYLTDNTDCQVFFGITDEPAILKAVSATMGQVILGSDKMVIECPFHSNCGGLTSSSGDVWLTHKPYLKSVADPFCQTSKNSRWKKSVTLERWTNYVKRSGYKGKTEDPAVFNFPQQSRSGSYKVGSFSLSFSRIRSEMHLPSAYFSVTLKGDSVLLDGRGSGHGVGLCQEGAMKMARQGYSYRQIINFYYSGVLISDIKKAVLLPQVLAMLATNTIEQKSGSGNVNSEGRSERFIIAASR
jgi:stage II sporulation protein D